jgi:hypothetical protein
LSAGEERHDASRRVAKAAGSLTWHAADGGLDSEPPRLMPPVRPTIVLAEGIVRRLIIVLAAVIGAACASQAHDQPNQQRQSTTTVLFSLSEEADYRRGIEALEAANVDRDVEAAIKIGDRRLIGMSGYTLVVPGADKNAYSPADVVTVKGTSDSIQSPAQERFQALLKTYAAAYNKAMLAAKK